MTETEGRTALAAYAHKRTEGADGAALILTFHGTGGDERQFHNLGVELMPGSHVISPRGDVSEAGHARFFRRRRSTDLLHLLRHLPESLPDPAHHLLRLHAGEQM